MDQISLWFVCKTCRSSFSGFTNFITHKTDNHFNEFKSVTCIVFEESFAEAEGDITTKPEGAEFFEDHVDGDCCSGKSQSPNLTLNNNNSIIINSDNETVQENKDFTNHEQDSVDSRAVSFTIENDSVTINVGPLNYVDSTFNPKPSTESSVPENGIYNKPSKQSTKVTVQEIQDSSDSEEQEQTINSPHVHENSDSELAVFSPQSVDLSLDSSQDVEINSVISSFDVCTDAVADVDCVNPGPEPVPFQSKSDKAENTFRIETSLATFELSEHRTCTTEENEDVSHSQSYDTAVKVVDNKYDFQENPFVLLRRLSNKELQGVLNISKEPINRLSKVINDTGSDMDYVSINSDTTAETSSDSEPDDTYYSKRRKINFKKNQLGSNPPKNLHPDTALKTTARKTPPLSFHCDLCNKSFKFRFKLITHNFRKHLPMEEKIALARFKCDHCPKVFLRKGALRSHAESHKSKTERNRPFVCEICGHSCTTRSELEKHLKSHSDSRPFKCQFPNCDKAYKQKKGLVIHENVFHSASRPFKCSHPNCTKTFKESKTLKAHTLGVHAGKRKFQLLACTQENCDKKYETGQGLKHHLIMVHSIGSELDLQKFLCELCGKEYKRKQNLQVHTLLVHTQDCPFKCRIEGCSAAFKLKYRLVEHERVHSGEKYLCTVCGKSYSIYISFNHHQLSHKKDSSSLKATA